MLIRNRSLRKLTGGLLTVPRKKKKHHSASQTIFTKLGATKAQPVRTRGGHVKQNLLTVDYANVLDPKTHKSQKSKITNVYANPADPQFIRRNIITKGALVDTEIGKARVTSRPGQDGVVNAVLFEQGPKTPNA